MFIAMLNLGMLKWSNLSENYIRKYLLQGEILIQHDTWKQSKGKSSQQKKTISEKGKAKSRIPLKMQSSEAISEHTYLENMVRVNYF